MISIVEWCEKLPDTTASMLVRVGSSKNPKTVALIIFENLEGAELPTKTHHPSPVQTLSEMGLQAKEEAEGNGWGFDFEVCRLHAYDVKGASVKTHVFRRKLESAMADTGNGQGDAVRAMAEANVRLVDGVSRLLAAHTATVESLSETIGHSHQMTREMMGDMLESLSAAVNADGDLKLAMQLMEQMSDIEPDDDNDGKWGMVWDMLRKVPGMPPMPDWPGSETEPEESGEERQEGGE